MKLKIIPENACRWDKFGVDLRIPNYQSYNKCFYNILTK